MTSTVETKGPSGTIPPSVQQSSKSDSAKVQKKTNWVAIYALAAVGVWAATVLQIVYQPFSKNVPPVSGSGPVALTTHLVTVLKVGFCVMGTALLLLIIFRLVQRCLQKPIGYVANPAVVTISRNETDATKLNQLIVKCAGKNAKERRELEQFVEHPNHANLLDSKVKQSLDLLSKEQDESMTATEKHRMHAFGKVMYLSSLKIKSTQSEHADFLLKQAQQLASVVDRTKKIDVLFKKS
ncbi:MAG: hypothetical protein H0X51_04740 [Parachlamydiaceae bacterium]|nr:hypothetical protein [Parachlamydiaceae bacterium]